MKAPVLSPVLILGDVHVPFEDRRAWELVLRVGARLKPVHLWLMGDFMDCYVVSAHDKDPQRKGLFEAEVQHARARLSELDALGAQRKVFLEGNHEQRLKRFLAQRAPELDGLVNLPELLRLRERGWTWVPYRSHLKVGKIHLTHDVGATGRNAIFRNLDTYQHSVLAGHTHRLAYVVEGNATGEQKLSAYFGWLGDRAQVDYLHTAKAAKDWALGFGVGWMEPSGICYLQPVPILVKGKRYSCCVRGELVEV